MKALLSILAASSLVVVGIAQQTPAPQGSDGDVTASLSQTAGHELQKSIQELNTLREAIENEKLPLAQELTSLEQKVSQLRQENDRVSRLVDEGNLADTPYHPKVIQELKAAAPSLSMQLTFVSVRRPEEIGPAFSTINRARAQALYVLDDPVLATHRMTLIKLASKARLPAISGQRDFADEGGLMSYGANFGDLFRRSAGYTDKILKGAKPGDLPIEQPVKFELVFNLKTAKALGLVIPQSLLARADEVVR